MVTPRHVMQNGQLRSTEACDPSKMANCSGVCSSLARAACNVFFGPFCCFGQAARPACPACPRPRITEFHRQPCPFPVDTRTESSHIITTRSGIGPLLVRKLLRYHRRGPPVGPDAPATNSHSPVISAQDSPVDQHGNGSPKNIKSPGRCPMNLSSSPMEMW